jgi:hypothetical protein
MNDVDYIHNKLEQGMFKLEAKRRQKGSKLPESGVYVLDLSDGPTFAIDIENETVSIVDEEEVDAICTVEGRAEDIAAVLRNPRKAATLFMARKVVVDHLPKLLPLLQALK